MAQQIKKQTVANVMVSMIERDVVYDEPRFEVAVLREGRIIWRLSSFEIEAAENDFERLVWKFGLDLAF